MSKLLANAVVLLSLLGFYERALPDPTDSQNAERVSKIVAMADLVVPDTDADGQMMELVSVQFLKNRFSKPYLRAALGLSSSELDKYSKDSDDLWMVTYRSGYGLGGGATVLVSERESAVLKMQLGK